MALMDFFSGTAFFVIVLLIISIWVIIELRRFRHKIFAIFLIISILFLYISVVVVFNGQEIDLKSISGIISAAKLYFSWLGSLGGNVKTIAANVIHLDWSYNSTGVKNNI